MIANWSRLSGFQECRAKQFHWDELRLKSWREADPLLMGGGFHVGAAVLFSEKSRERALVACEKDMRDRYAQQQVLPEERGLIEHNIEWTKRAVEKFSEHYELQDITVLWPEVEFCIPMPNTLHHCFFAHRLLHPKVPYDQCPLAQFHNPPGGTPHEVEPPSPFGFDCVRPHFFKGKTDAIVQWMTKIWLFEHKTNSMTPEIFYKKYLLDAQATGYMWGIWKQLGVKPEGFILNVIQKPRKNAKDQLWVGFEREPYFRSNEDLDRFALEFVEQANDYENAFRRAILGNRAAVYMNTKACTNYSRQCYYMDYCQRHFEEAPGEFALRDNDYINDAYFDILGLPKPEKKLLPIINQTEESPDE
jgi:hypothetical protein